MNIVAKIRRLSDEIEDIKARLTAIEGTKAPEVAALLAPIVDAMPIVSDTLAPLPRKRGRPPKPKS
jgi:hypothetical protein